MSEINKNGCTIIRSFHLHRERYHYDFSLIGWDNYDTPQDASYFGVWINRDSLSVITFAEGDETRSIAPDQKAFDAELADMAVFYNRVTTLLEMMEPLESVCVRILDSNQPATCPRCGVRTEFYDLTDKQQRHTCPSCLCEFVGVFNGRTKTHITSHSEGKT